ncbi:ABC transporter substrate-binding protein [Corynebacterium phocae]|uniref:ABC transporter substrate-binding protein n=1 Tax=Corynebacterium phocae TaxID=161895 RepID=A0A1L7D0Y2_9CORY|nr:ABC transporter substrate-binding protein [Corynebacterium phocae]APT91754.1 ABC transporter substrate-binding protein [Corynebacterium phocae]KAA8728518.1 ABC transporter substrate-binding protein [Corynebacterium phocae]
MPYPKSATAVVLGTTLLSTTLVACSTTAEESTTDKPAAEPNYILAQSTEPQNPLIPAYTVETGGGRLVKAIFAGLVYYDAQGNVHNEVAESIEPNGDNTVFTIKLKDWKFSDGSEVTAHSFVDAWNYSVSHDLPGSFFFEPIKGFADSVESLEGLEVIDDKTFTITLDQPQSDFPARLGDSAFYPLPEAAFADIQAYGEKPISNGPYLLKEWSHNNSALVVPNPDYHGARTVKNDGVLFTFYPTADAAYADLLANNLDVLDAIPDSALAVYQDDLGQRTVNQAVADFRSFTIPQNLPHFGGEEGRLRRQAISMAIDRKEIIDTIFQGNLTPAQDFTTPVLPGWTGEIPGNEVLSFQPDKARQLWEKANDISPWEGTFELAYDSAGGNQAWVDAISNQLSNNLGIAAAGAPYPDFKSMRDKVSSRTIDTAFRTKWKADYPSLENFLVPLYATGGNANDGDYSNPEFDQLLKQAASAHSPQEAYAIYNQAQEILLEDLPAIPLWYNNLIAGYSENVSDVEFSWNSTPLYHQVTKTGARS